MPRGARGGRGGKGQGVPAKGGFGAAPATGGFGAAPARFVGAPAAGFGAQPAQGGFGGAQGGFGGGPQGGFGQSGAGGFNSGYSQGGFGSTQPQGGFGAARGGFGGGSPQGGFGAPQPGFGSTPVQGGFASSPARGGFGAPAASGGFGAARGGFGSSQGGFGGPQGGFGQAASAKLGAIPGPGGFGAKVSAVPVQGPGQGFGATPAAVERKVDPMVREFFTPARINKALGIKSSRGRKRRGFGVTVDVAHEAKLADVSTFLDDVLRDAVAFTEHNRRRTINLQDMIGALRLQGYLVEPAGPPAAPAPVTTETGFNTAAVNRSAMLAPRKAAKKAAASRKRD